MAAKPFAFVLMPFEQSFDDIYKLGIQAVAAEKDIIAERVDEQSFRETILERIYRQIQAADFIVADMTGRNPNVFYEVGYAHALDKLCTLITQSASDIPFDLKHHRHIIYDGSINTLRDKLSIEFDWLRSENALKNTRPMLVELRSAYGDLSKTEYLAQVSVDIIFDIHNKTERRSPEIEAIYLYTSGGWRVSQNNEDCPSTEATGEKSKLRHFIKSPVARLSTGAWAQLSLIARRTAWTKWSGDELKKSYNLRGTVTLELCTSEGNFTERFPLDVQAEEMAF